jgi:hypothetical protein
MMFRVYQDELERRRQMQLSRSTPAYVSTSSSASVPGVAVGSRMSAEEKEASRMSAQEHAEGRAELGWLEARNNLEKAEEASRLAAEAAAKAGRCKNIGPSVSAHTF